MKRLVLVSLALLLFSSQTVFAQDDSDEDQASVPERQAEWVLGGNIHPAARMKIDDFEATNYETTGLNFDWGKILNRNLVLGGRFSFFDATKKEKYFENSASILSLGPLLTYFPMGSGVFLKAGLQWSALVTSYKDHFPNQKESDDSYSTSGYGGTAGFGYSFDLGTGFQIAVDAEYGRYSFKKTKDIDASPIQTWSGGMGLYYKY